jgi:hypothetical protein
MAAPMTIAVVYLHTSLDILSPQVKSAPPRGSRLWLRPQTALCGHWAFFGLRPMESKYRRLSRVIHSHASF